MTKSAGKRAIQIFLAAATASAMTTHVAAQVHAPILFVYEQASRPWTYLRGRMNPYVDRKTDFFGGIDAAKSTTFAWMGVTWAPMGILDDDGWRIRLKGGAGHYTYRTPVSPDGSNDANAFSAEALGGYRKTFDNVLGQRLYVGAFAGLHYEDQILIYNDPANRAAGSELGIIGSIEVYSRIADRYVATAFATVSSVHNKYHAKATLLYELNGTWALGGELAVLGDARYDEQRVGAVAALYWQKRIISLSAGALENSGRGNGGYLTLSVYSPF
jgi:hypothetical protein